MQLIPAIDLYDGACVRLLRGDFATATTYASDPLGPARAFAESGAPLLHVVDLDGARHGHPVNHALIGRIGELADVQAGGGLRTAAGVAALLDSGAARAVIGSIAVTEQALTERLLREHGPERMVLALDVRAHRGQYRISTHGWTHDTALALGAALDRYLDLGLRHVLITDIGRDGAMNGPNLPLYREVSAAYPSISVQASGGVRDTDDLAALADTGVAAAISGRALLEKKIDLREVAPFLRSA